MDFQRKNGFTIYIICATIFCAFLAFSNQYDELETRITNFIIFAFALVLCPIGIKLYWREMDKPLTEEELMRKIRANTSNGKAIDYSIDYTILVSSDSKKSVSSSIARGIVGGAILGPAGMVGGAISGKNKSKTTFTIVYKNGQREVKTVDNNSEEFSKYASYLK